MSYTLKNFHKTSGSVLPEWKYFVKLQFANEDALIDCNAQSITHLVEQIHEEIEKRCVSPVHVEPKIHTVSRNDFNADFNWSVRFCKSNQITAGRMRPFSEEDENLFLKLLTDSD